MDGPRVDTFKMAQGRREAQITLSIVSSIRFAMGERISGERCSR